MAENIQKEGAAVVVCNGTPPSEKLFHEQTDLAELLIAADGGVFHCLRYGKKPHVVIGDMDSFDPDLYPELYTIRDTDQETNDLEKALYHALSLNVKEVVILGAIGLRLDHSLKNVSVLKRFSKKFNSILFLEDGCRIILLPPSFTCSVKPGQIVSLFPLSGVVTGITTVGLHYPLNDEQLQNGVRDGTSNFTTSNRLSIQHATGDLLLFLYESES